MPQNKLPLYGTLFFDVTTHNPTTLAISDADWVPQYEVFEDDTDTPIVGTINLTKRTNKTGDYRGRLYADPSVGFEVGGFYNIIVSGTVNSIAGKIVRDTFQIGPAENIPGVSPTNVSHLSNSPMQQSEGYIGIDWNLINNKTVGAQFPNTQMGTVVSLGHPARAQVNAEADTALIDINLDQLAKIAVTSSFAASVHLSSILGQMADKGSATFDRTTDSLEAIRDRGDAAWTTGAGGSTFDTFGTLAAIKAKTDNLPVDPADASDVAASFSTVQGTLTLVSSRIPSALTAAGHIKSDVLAISGDLVAADNLEAAFDGTGGVSITATFAGALTGQVGSLGQVAKAEVNAEADTALVDINLDHLVKLAVDTDFPTTVHLSSVLGQMSDDGSAATFDRTTDSLEAIRNRGDAAWGAGGSGSDLFGTLSAIKLRTDNLPTDPADASDIAASFTSAETSRNLMFGTLSAIKLKTDNLPSDPADASDIAASFTTEATARNFLYGTLSAIKVKTDNLPTDPTDASDVAASFSTVNSTLSTISGFLDTEIAAILADTTQIKADLPQQITKNTALANFPFKMVLSSDHVTAATGLAITATRSLDGAAFAACANSASEIGGGMYKINLAAADLNATTVILRFVGTGADTREVVLFPQPT